MTVQLPSQSTFASHGLTDVALDHPFSPESSTSPSSDDTDEGWVTGCGVFSQDKLDNNTDVAISKNLRFAFCPHGNALAVARFRRRAQLLAFDCLVDDNVATRHDSKRHDVKERKLAGFSRMRRIIAWKEDEHGLWLVGDEELPGRRIRDWWAGMTQRTSPRKASAVTFDMVQEVSNGTHAGAYTNEACEVLLSIVERLQVLHSRNLALVSCKPRNFSLESASGSHTAWIEHLTDIAALPGFESPAESLAADVVSMEPNLSEYLSARLTETFVRENLQYLAPEVADSRRATRVGDIYSFGTLAYELLTGTTVDGNPSHAPADTEGDLLSQIHRQATLMVPAPIERWQGTSSTSTPPRQLSEIVMRCLEKDPDERYSSLTSLAYDLRKLGQICRSGGNLNKFIVGEVDLMSRFAFPSKPVHRELELLELDNALNALRHTPEMTSSKAPVDYLFTHIRVVNIWGYSGSGKSQMAAYWTRNLEVADHGSRCLVGTAKLDEQNQRPLSSFIQVFQSLLGRVLTDPREDATKWNRKIRDILGLQFPTFVSLLSSEFRAMVSMDPDTKVAESIDWHNFISALQGWSKQLLQLFATKDRPLVLMIDDIQWMPKEEVDIWRTLLEGPQTLEHALVLSLYRVTLDSPPPAAALLSMSSISLRIAPLDEEGVGALISECLRPRVDNMAVLTNILSCETDGSPLYLRTILADLVQEEVLYFDFDILSWRFDLLRVQGCLSDTGVDGYIKGTLFRLAPDVQETLLVLSTLPATGFRIDLLGAILQASTLEVRERLEKARDTGNFVEIGLHGVKFSHDRFRMAAYNMIQEERLPMLHQRISEYLRRPDLYDDHVFEAADHALVARSFGAVSQELDNDFVCLLLDAASKSALSASFSAAKRYLDAVQDLLDSTGGVVYWLGIHRRTYLRFLSILSDVCGILKLHEDAFVKLDGMVQLCESDAERVMIATLRVKQRMSANRHSEAMDLVWETLRDQGYDPASPRNVELWTPSSAEEVYDMVLTDDAPADDNVQVMLMNLLAYAGPTIFVTRPDDRAAAFALGMSLIYNVGQIHDSTSYLLSAHAITIDNVRVIQALSDRAKQLCALRPDSLLTGSTLVVIVYLAHYSRSLEYIHKDTYAAYQATTSMGNYEVTAYVWALDLAARIFSRQSLDWEVLVKQYHSFRYLTPTTFKLIIHAPLQCAENYLQYPPKEGEPWDMRGSFLSAEDLELSSSLLMHVATWYTYALRLALLYDAPQAKQEALLSAGTKFAAVLGETIIGIEWSFLAIVVILRRGAEPEAVDARYKGLQKFITCPDFEVRVKFIDALRSLLERGLDAIPEVERAIAAFDESKYYTLSGWLNYYASGVVKKHTGSAKLSSGFLRDAYDAYKLDHATGICQWLNKTYPLVCPPMKPEQILPSQLFNTVSQAPREKPVMMRSTSAPNTDEASGSIRNSNGSGPGQPDAAAGDGQLDTLTLMTSSLSLASEQDPSVLLCTLLRILCQYTMSNFAAIGLNDPHDRATLRIRAAGSAGYIVPHDLSISEAANLEVCPATYMLHVARTGQEITAPMLPSLRPEPFYGSKYPRNMIAMPILNQGNQVGVILLSSTKTMSSAAHGASARGVVACLATFASIVIFNNSFTKRLKQEVEERTRDLTSALAAKTQFLSQCSHELRTPLSSILGLAAVMQAGSDLSVVQLEHVQTIMSSGEDLLELINNILDHSRIESGSVTPEQIPFSLRNVVEDAVEALAAVGWNKEVDLYLTSPFHSDPPDLIGDPFRIKQVVLNLLSNAIKFTRKGRVTIAWRFQQVREDEVKIWIDVVDTGIGIPAHKMDKLFRSFSQVDESITRNFGGSGLGLVISRDLARLLKGDCTAVSELGKGSRFTFSFTAGVGAVKTAASPLPDAQSCLAICSDVLWKLTLEEQLADLNCVPSHFCGNADEFLSSDLNRDDFAYNIVLVDTGMMSKELQSTLQGLTPLPKIIYLVHSLNINAAMDNFQIPRDQVLTLSPIRFASLRDALRSDRDSDTSKRGSAIKREKVGKSNREMAKAMPLDILLVDDNLVNLKVGKRILAMFGYANVASATDGRMAIEAAEKHHFDLILMDLQMPILDGFTAHERIKASPLAGYPCVVALTANADLDTRQRCKLAGFFDYLSKPLVIPLLEKTIAAAFVYRQKDLDSRLATLRLEAAS